MSPSPHIAFVSFRSMEDTRLTGWATNRERLGNGSATAAIGNPSRGPELIPSRAARGSTAAAGERGLLGIWRLLASNNRELGRSASIYASFAEARLHVLALQMLADDMVVSTVTGPSAGTHAWMVAVTDTIVMTSGRWYGAASAGREAGTASIRALQGAVVVDESRPGKAGENGDAVSIRDTRELAQ